MWGKALAMQGGLIGMWSEWQLCRVRLKAVIQIDVRGETLAR